MIRALIFDLDNCLAAADEAGSQLYEPAFLAIRQTNHGTLSDEALDRAFADCWRHPLDWVAAKPGFSERMLAVAWAGLITAEARRPMGGYGDLGSLARWPVQRSRVPSGFRRLQKSKIRALKPGH